MDATGRTPLKTEIRWLLGVLLVAVVAAVGGALYFIWTVLDAGAGC